MTARWNIAETCVDSLTFGELVDLGGDGERVLEELRRQKLTYGYIYGRPRLRELIAATYAHGDPKRVLTTPGATKWYRANSRTAAQTTHVRVGANAIVEWLPLETIVFERKHGRDLKNWGFETQGMVVLFTGLPGTGKTMAAEAIASALKKDLLIVRADKVHTGIAHVAQENIGRLFEEVKGRIDVLFIDEAEAMLGQRIQNAVAVRLVSGSSTWSVK